MQQRREDASDIRLAEVVATLSLATDLGMGQPPQYALRSCVLAVQLGQTLGLDDRQCSDIFYLTLLRFAGCTADSPLAAATFGDELAVRPWLATIDYARPSQVLLALIRNLGAGESPLRRGRILANAVVHLPQLVDTAASHCEVAQRLSERLGLGAQIEGPLAHIYERWDGKGMPKGVKGEEVALAARIVSLAQDAEIFHRMGGMDAAVAVAKERAGKAYDPAIVDCFCRHAPQLLAATDSGSVWHAVLDVEPPPRPRLSGEQLDTALRAMADFVDLKSPYTGNHSSGVARLAAEAAKTSHVAERDSIIVYRAALLHDLGRVGVSSAVWEKPGPLNDEEWEQVRLHPYHTERVLSRSNVLAPLGTVAALHHERLDGSGYHRCLPAPMLSPCARILAAADAYHAMTEPRPHREALSPDVAAQQLHNEVRLGKLDGDAVNAVLAAAGHHVLGRRRVYPAGLSEREVEVLRLLARGLSNRQMATRLIISRATIDHHIRHIYDKVGVSTRAAATLFALQHELVHDLGDDLTVTA